MCGIIGYIGKKQAFPLLIKGLRRLEYRGYDSIGLCTVQNNKLNIIKKKGKISEIFNKDKKSKVKVLKGCFGIAHTRWATHGEPNEINAHPHLDCNKEIAIVHNGIIENYSSLKKLLEREGHKIISKTDSEVFAHLIEKFYKNNSLESALRKTLKLVEGTYGLAVISEKEEKILIAKKGSPLVIGVGNDEMFIASDVTAILEYTKKIIYLNDDEMAVIKADNYQVSNFSGRVLNKEISNIKWGVSEIEKAHFKHFMLKEIFEQPKALENVLRGRITQSEFKNKTKNKIKSELKLTLNLDVKSLKKIIIVACGTSWHSALIGKYILEKLIKIPVEVDYASEFRYRDPIIKKNDLVIVISQSGETADTLAALKLAKMKKAKTLGIINVVGSTISREVDSGIYIHAGPEIGVASTKAFCCQILTLVLFGLFVKQEKKIELDDSFLDEIKNLPEKIKEVLNKSSGIREIAKKFKKIKNCLYLGRGINFPVALEGALKLKEISYIHAEGYPAAEMKHGPIALIDKKMPVIFICSKGKNYEKILSNIQEVKARGGRIIVVTDEKDKRLEGLAEIVLKVPKTREELSPIINVIPLQLLAYHIADLKKINVDKPRNLAKSVTVE